MLAAVEIMALDLILSGHTSASFSQMALLMLMGQWTDPAVTSQAGVPLLHMLSGAQIS